MEFGRWASVSSARLYLRRGEVALLRCRGEFNEDIEKRFLVLCSVGRRVLALVMLLD